MAKKNRQKPSIGSDPFSGHEEIMQSFFSNGPEPESISDCGLGNVDLNSPLLTPHSPLRTPHSSLPQPSIDNAMFPTFQTELEEGLERLDPLLVDLEKNPDDSDLINEAFRIVHTIKGSAGFMQFHKLKGLCHGLESLLAQVRSKKLNLSVALMDIILQAVDKMKEAGLKITENRNEEGFDAGPILFLLESLSGTPTEECGRRNAEGGMRSEDAPAGSGADLNSPLPTPHSALRTPHSEIPQPVTDSGIDKSIVDDFIQEAQEGLDKLDADLITLEENPEDKELLNKVFRIMHTLKGAAGFIGLVGVQATAHKSEDVLNKIRSGELKSSPLIVDVLLEALDVLKNLLKDLAESGVEKTDNSNVVKRLQMVLDDPSVSIADCGLRNVDASTGLSTGLKPEIPNPKSQIPPKQAVSTIRVDVDKLDNLMNLAGELVLARNRQIQLNRDITAELGGKEKLLEEVGGAAGQLDFITMELQFAVMKTRMLPVSTVFGKFTRVVRDLSRSLGKEVELAITGEGTELDKNIVEEIGDPMVHLIRNSVDHGIETPEERRRQGKNPKGTINLSAYHEGSHVIIEIRDDGKGMDPEKLKAKALEKGVITKEEAEAMSQGQALRLIFAPGFSTAEKVSDVSGRGVGMDVVRSNIEKLKGIIELESAVGKGSIVKIKIPLTLAILPTLHCKVGSERYGIPLASVKETVRMPYCEVQTIRGKSVVKLREEILPLAFLQEILDVEAAPLPELCVVVLQVGAQRLGCVVDDTIGQEEVVIKPLDAIKHICQTPFFSGAAILGNGTITLILDVSELARLINVTGLHEEPSIDNQQSTIDNSKDIFTALLVEDGGAEQYALPIQPIKKIENIPSREIEIVGGRKVVKNDGNVLPVVHLYDITNFPPSKPESDVYLVVMGENGERTGLVVNGLRGIKTISIPDCGMRNADASTGLSTGLKSEIPNQKSQIKGRQEAEDCFSSEGIAFSAVLDGRVTLVLADGAVSRCSRDYMNSQRASSTMEAALISQKRGRILVVDDSAVARECIRKFLLESGFDVVLAVDGKDALQKLAGIDLVVTDLEMPEMNGYELTRAIKKDHPGLPIIMVTTRDGEEDRLEGLKAGVDDYQGKLDGLKLVHSVQRHIKKK